MLVCAELFVALLNSKELNFDVKETAEGHTVVSIPFDGKMLTCFFAGENGKYFSLYCRFEEVPEDKLADAIFTCNALNTEYKWATFYVDKDNDIMIHDDAILSVDNAADEAFEILIRILNIGKEAKPIIMKALYA